MTNVSIYLAGNIQKGHEKESGLFWTEDNRKVLRSGLNPREVTFLNPALRTDDLSDQLSVFGRDMTQIFTSDLIFVDARERRGLGVGAEMMFAKMHAIPVITWAPKKSHYRREKVELLGVEVDNWVHPFVESLSDAIVHSLEDSVEWIEALMLGDVQEIKGPDFIHSAMQHYQNTHFENDQPMQILAGQNPELLKRIKAIK